MHCAVSITKWNPESSVFEYVNWFRRHASLRVLRDSWNFAHWVKFKWCRSYFWFSFGVGIVHVYGPNMRFTERLYYAADEPDYRGSSRLYDRRPTDLHLRQHQHGRYDHAAHVYFL